MLSSRYGGLIVSISYYRSYYSLCDVNHAELSFHVSILMVSLAGSHKKIGSFSFTMLHWSISATWKNVPCQPRAEVPHGMDLGGASGFGYLFRTLFFFSTRRTEKLGRSETFIAK